MSHFPFQGRFVKILLCASTPTPTLQSSEYTVEETHGAATSGFGFLGKNREHWRLTVSAIFVLFTNMQVEFPWDDKKSLWEQCWVLK